MSVDNGSIAECSRESTVPQAGCGERFSGYIQWMDYLKGLNDAQREAVLATDGPVSVLAGAGSGKTRVLATRIYHLVRSGVPAERILAVTFTNKAAREMRERVRVMLGAETPAPRSGAGTAGLPFVATFHGLGRELLESYGSAIGIPRFFSVYDRDDSERVIAAALKALDVSAKELSPRAVLGRISRHKGDGMRAREFNNRYGRSSFGGRVTADVWLRYENVLKEEKALDFDDLIAEPVRLLEEHPEAREAAQKRWQYIHIDEYQDTNELQERLASILAERHKNLFVVGDGDQCLAGGTKIRMADGSEKAIEKVREGDSVLSNYGSGSMRPARVAGVRSHVEPDDLVRITTRAGYVVTSTAEHIHFAGYRLGETPQLHFTYLMHKHGVGWRLGTSQVYTRGQKQPVIGFQQRCIQEHADEAWIVGVFDTQQEARVRECLLSLEYQLPTIPFVARKGGGLNGYVHDQDAINRIFASFDTDSAARRLLASEGLSLEYPHHPAQGADNRRNAVLTLCGDRRGATPMHRIAMVGKDAETAGRLRASGFSVRSAKRGSESWRFETSYKEYGRALDDARRIRKALPDVRLVQMALLGGQKKNLRAGNSLPFLPAGSVRRGMALFSGDARWDVVENVEYVRGGKRVYDLDVEYTHNFIANDVTTHNCIYGWRGAKMENILNFDKKYPEAQTIILERNYRSTKTLVDAANAVIVKNKNRKAKSSTTEQGAGEPIVLNIAGSAESEAHWVAQKARELIGNGEKPEEIAILFRTNFQSRALEEGLLRAGVPYKLLGTKFFGRKEVKDVLSWMRLAMDPSREADKMRAAASPPRGIGAVTLGKLAAGQRATLGAANLAKVEAFERTISDLAAAAETCVPSEFVKLVIEKSGMRRALVDEGTEEDRERFENIEELASVAARHDGARGREGVALFLAESALAGDQDELDQGEKSGVVLMTVHAAKGLEFDTVFVTGMEEGLFPHVGIGDGKRDEEEERRLFYVAVTRARKRLFLTLARVRKIYGSDTYAEPSSFLSDLDESLLQRDEPVAGGFVSARERAKSLLGDDIIW